MKEVWNFIEVSSLQAQKKVIGLSCWASVLTPGCECLRDTDEERKSGVPIIAQQSAFVLKSERMKSPDILAVPCEEFEKEKKKYSLSSLCKKRRKKLQKHLIDSFDGEPTTKLY